MIRGPDAQTGKFLTDLVRISRRLEKAQYQITSGRRINSVSDAPDDIPRLLEMRTQLQSTEQTRTNLSRVQSEVDTAEGALQSAVQLMDRAMTLGTQGATDVASADQRNTLADEIQALMEQMVNAASSTSEGRYIFAGDADQSQPYTIDTTLDNPMSFYNGSASTRQVMHPTGTLFKVAKTAEEIFDNANPSRNVFQTLNAMRLALRSNDGDAVRAALIEVRTAGGHLNNMLAYYGTVQGQIREAVDFSQQQELRLKTQISSVQDADMTTAVLDLNQAQFQQQTALAAQGRLKKLSLFDYLA